MPVLPAGLARAEAVRCTRQCDFTRPGHCAPSWSARESTVRRDRRFQAEVSNRRAPESLP